MPIANRGEGIRSCARRVLSAVLLGVATLSMVPAPEVHGYATIPPQYPDHTFCGVVLLWTQ